jgi:4-hydroxybenzoate polyprenyltransferase
LSTWSRTSTRSSTSVGPPRGGPTATLVGLIRLVHPFPSLLDGLVVAGVASIAGSGPGAAVLLGLSMTFLQGSIGAVNDIVDAPRDAIAKPDKPIPAGLVSRTTASTTAVIGGGLGLALGWLAGPHGASVVLIGLVVLGIGFAYDLWFKGTAWSWLPFAVGIPLLPVYGWVGSTGGLSESFAVLIPAAIVAGAALAIANARADEARDQASGTVSVATGLGARRSWWIEAILLALVVVTAALTLVFSGAGSVPFAGVVLATALIAAGLAIGRSDDAGPRERAWEIQAIGVAMLAAAWLAGFPLAG